MRPYLYPLIFFIGNLINAQAYIVNTNDDKDDGICDGFHCSLREAINAAEADGLPSVINFNIPGVGPHSIVPAGPFPTVTQNDLTILGETQSGGQGSIIIDFNYRNFGNIGFWDILGKGFYLSGVNFTDFLFDNLTFNSIEDHILKFGDFVNNASGCQITNCSFITDNTTNTGDTITPRILIHVFNAAGIKISNCNFGTDHSKSSINYLLGCVYIDSIQRNGIVEMDSNIFANKIIAIYAFGGELNVKKNIFGALDTSKITNFIEPNFGIRGLGVQKSFIQDNFFFGYTTSIDFSGCSKDIVISWNRFYYSSDCVLITGNRNNKVYVTDNFAKHGFNFMNISFSNTNINVDLFIERNDTEDFSRFILGPITTSNNLRSLRHIDNKIACYVGFTPIICSGERKPVITTVNRDQITGTGMPFDSVVVYYNQRIGCPNARCPGGYELGRTQADASGKWILNALYPNNATISAFQFHTFYPIVYSEFTNCFSCPAPVITKFNPTICSGQTVNYKGRMYSDLNPQDSFVNLGNGVICDSIHIVKLSINKTYRTQIDVSVCYNDTLRFENVLIHKNHLEDSIKRNSVFGCDSVVIITAKEVGVGFYKDTICNNEAVTIFGNRYDVSHSSGIAIGKDSAVTGCDSVVFVNLLIKNTSEYFLNQIMCPGKDTLVQGQLFNQARPSGDVTLPGGSSKGCDSLIHVSLTYPNNVGSFSATICPEDSVLVVNKYFSRANPNGQVVITSGSSIGCDSVVNVSINIHPIPMSSYSTEICKDDTIKLGSQQELFYIGKTTGILFEKNAASNGCDSLVNVSLSVIQDAVGRFDTTMCENQTRMLYGETFSVLNPQGILTLPNASVKMCDSILNVNITFVSEVVNNFSKTICRNDIVKVGSQIFDVNKMSGLVRLIGESTLGCDSIVNVTLSINPSIFLDFSVQDLICNLKNTGELSIQDLGGGSGNLQYSIDGGPLIKYIQDTIIGNLSQGTHTIHITDALSCDTSYNFNIDNSAILSLQLPNDTTVHKGDAININPNLNFNPATIIWSPASYLDCDTCLNPQSRPDSDITYTLTLTDENGCEITDQITIAVLRDVADIFTPTAFSPNGDNVNDFFGPIFKFPKSTRILVFRIFDRWGNQLYEQLNGATNQTFGWDGTSNGEKMNPGVYVYTIQFIGDDNIVKWKSGDVTLLR